MKQYSTRKHDRNTSINHLWNSILINNEQNGKEIMKNLHKAFPQICLNSTTIPIFSFYVFSKLSLIYSWNWQENVMTLKYKRLQCKSCIKHLAKKKNITSGPPKRAPQLFSSILHRYNLNMTIFALLCLIFERPKILCFEKIYLSIWMGHPDIEKNRYV